MRRSLFLLGILASCCLAATAQGPEGVGASARSTPRMSVLDESASPNYLFPWRFSVGYQYNRINLTGTPFNTTGINASVSRMFGRWFGVEGQVGFGTGNTGSATSPSNLTMKSLFAGGGPRLVYRGRSRWELWAHALGGAEHLQFNKTAGVFNNNTGPVGMGGGGVDFKLNRNVTITGEADEFETKFFGGYQRHFQATTSLAFHY